MGQGAPARADRHSRQLLRAGRTLAAGDAGHRADARDLRGRAAAAGPVRDAYDRGAGRAYRAGAAERPGAAKATPGRARSRPAALVRPTALMVPRPVAAAQPGLQHAARAPAE